MDKATVESSDAMLKTLEDLAQGPLRIVLWAEHLLAVMPTIRSRTQQIWCGACKASGTKPKYSKSVKKSAESVVQAHRLGNKLLTAMCAALEENDAESLLEAIVDSLEADNERDLQLWEKIRPIVGKEKWASVKTVVIYHTCM
jgi:hypothetical protein